MRKYLLLFLTVFLLCFVGCQKKPIQQEKDIYTIDTFQINKDFNVVDFNQDNKLITLDIKSDHDISEYLNDLYSSFKKDKLTFHIYLYNNDATNTEFSTDNLENFIGYINYRVDMKNYMIQKYVILPQVDIADNLSAFTNKDVNNENNLLKISIEMNTDEMTLYDIVSQLKLYISFVQKENNFSKPIQITLNNQYIYQNENYIIEQSNIDF